MKNKNLKNKLIQETKLFYIFSKQNSYKHLL